MRYLWKIKTSSSPRASKGTFLGYIYFIFPNVLIKEFSVSGNTSIFFLSYFILWFSFFRWLSFDCEKRKFRILMEYLSFWKIILSDYCCSWFIICWIMKSNWPQEYGFREIRSILIEISDLVSFMHEDFET